MNHRFTRLGEFADPAVEADFRAACLPTDRTLVRAMALLYIGLGLPYAVYIAVTATPCLMLSLTHLARAGMLVLAVYLAVGRRLHHDVRFADGLMMAFVLLFMVQEVLVSLTAGQHTIGLLVFSLTVLVSWTLLPNRMSFQVVMALGGTASLLLAHALGPTVPVESLGVSLFFIAFSNVFGVFARQRLNVATRGRYLAAEAAAHRAKRFTMLSAEVPVAVLILDEARAVVWANARAAAMFEVSREDLNGTLVGVLLPDSAVVIGQPFPLTVPATGHDRIWRGRAQALPPGDDGWAIMVVIQDVTDVTMEFQREARTDPLTGLFNRRGFSEAAERHLERARRWTQPVAVLFADLDRFKHVNDAFGHPVGDTALEGVAHSLRQAVRPGDPAGRFGGEEFVVLLPDANLAQATAVAERVRAAVASNPLVLVDGQEISLTISVGVTLVGPGEALDTAIDRADRAMLLAKRGGRNQVVSLAP